MANASRTLELVRENLRAQSAQEQHALAELPGLEPFDTVGLSDVVDAPTLLRRAFQGLRLTFEPLRRTTQAFRETVLLGTGRMPVSQFRRRMGLALTGRAELSTRSFLELMIGKEHFDLLRRTPWVPGWAPSITNPEMSFVDRIKTGRVSVGDLVWFGTDVLMDPFSMLALTPVGAGAKLTGAISRVSPGAAKAVGFPWAVSTRVLSRALGPRNPFAFWTRAREFIDVQPEALTRAFLDAQHTFLGAAGDDLRAAETIAKGAKGALRRYSDFDNRLGAWLYGREVRFSDAERPIAEAFRDLLWRPVREAAEGGQEWAQSILARAPESPLQHLVPKILYGKKQIPIDLWQSWSTETLGRVGLGLERVRATGVNVDDIPLAKFSGINAVRDFVYATNKKAHFEPTLLRFRPRPTGEPEDPLTADLAQWQTRHLRDTINALTGHARGRAQIEFDVTVADFFHRLSQSPGGARVEKLMRRLGAGDTIDGLPDFSITTKLTGILVHGVAVNALGLRLKSALVNTTQTLNYAVARGLPATLHGALRLGDPAYIAARANAGLVRDVSGLFSDEAWIGWGKWSKALMRPFTIAEEFIRGVGFNVGLDAAIKKRGLGSLSEVSEATLPALMREAHFESVNGAFIYGTLGRAPMLNHPLVRPFTPLMSFPFKQGEFLRRTFIRDGSAFARFIGLHGFLVEKMNEYAGVAAEDFLGWGFTPMTRTFDGIPLILSPPGQALIESARGLSALARDDRGGAERAFRSARRGLELIAPPVGTLFVRDLATSLERWREGVQRIGEGQVPISRPDVIRNYLVGRSTTQRMRSDLRERMARATRRIDFTLDKRVRAYLDAAAETDGDAFASRAWDLVQPISIEGKPFYPDPEQIESRMRGVTRKRTVSRDVLAMRDNQFLARIYMGAYLRLLERTR